jgi:thioredoxin reductase (NADPH)
MSERGAMKLTLLSRAWCHLCDEMLDALRPLAAAGGASLDVIDIDAPANAALEAAWGDKVPVLFAGAPGADTLLCHYHLDRRRVAAALTASGAAHD